MKKSVLKFKLIAIFIWNFFLFCSNAIALTQSTGTPEIDFGSFAQLQENASIVLPSSGSTTQVGISNYIGSPEAATVTYVVQTGLDFGRYESATLSTPSDSVITTDKCIITLTNYDLSSTSVTVYREGNWLSLPTSATVNYGATLNISGFCEAREYNGTFTIPYTSKNCALLGSCSDNTDADPISISWKVTIWDRIGATETQSLDFGSMMTPQADAKVIMSPSGVRSRDGYIWIDPSNAGRPGSFEVVSSGNRAFYVEFPNSATLSGSGGTMVVDNFTVNDGELSTSSDGTAVFNVGATLNVPANISAGTYTGEYNVRVYY